MPETRDISQLKLSAQDPGAWASLSRKTAQDVAGSVPSSAYEKFGLNLMNMLKRYQSLGTGKFQEAELQGREKQAGQILAESTPGMAPGLQSQIRSAQASAIEPAIRGAQEMKQTFTEQIAGLGDVLKQASAIGQWMQTQEQEKQESARDLVFKLPSAVKALGEKEKRELEKSAGLQSGLIDLLPEEKKEEWMQITLSDGSLAQQNTKTGQIQVLSKPVAISGAGISKPLSTEQGKVRQFAVTAENSNNLLNASKYKLGYVENPYIPNVFKSSERQGFEQAARAFVNSVLRRESGATITDDEFKNKYKELIPQAGDSNDVINQKKQARNIVVKQLKEGGLLETQEEITASDGSVWRINPDGTMTQIQ